MGRQKKLEILESLRGFAAFYVLGHHLTLNQHNFFSYIFAEGQAAVILFFLISGFVIFYSVKNIQSKKDFRFKNYFVKRFRRIYPIFICALIIAYITQCISQQKIVFIDSFNLLGNILNLQDIKRIPGNWFIPFCSNNPLWSLSYEWWFYMLFFFIFKTANYNKQKIIALSLSIIGFVSFIIFPNKISITLEYFWIWWSGAELAKSWLKYGKINLSTTIFVYSGYGIMLLLLGLQIWFYKGKLNLENHPIIEFRHYAYGLLFILLGQIWQKYHFKGYSIVLKPFLLIAPISYGIYVFHGPLTYRNSHLFGFKDQWGNYICGVICTFILAYFFEIKVQKWINKITDKLFIHKHKKSVVITMIPNDKVMDESR